MTPSGSNEPAGPIDEGGGRALTIPSPTGGFSGWLVNLAAPIAYLAMVLLVAFVIARRRLERRERAALVGTTRAAPDPDSLPVRRVEPRPEPIAADDEENMPRWLRPSVRAERFGMDQARARVMPEAFRLSPPARVPLTFGGAPADLSDRRVILSAAAVGLLAQADAAGRRLAELEHGDQVEILETEGQWANVLTPTGLAGWLPTVVLAELTGGTVGSGRQTDVDAALDARPGEPAVPATPTTPATPADQPLDLAAYLAARRRDDTRTGSSGVG